MSHAQTVDARLLRRVRWQLVAWSGGVVLVVLLALGLATYLAVARSLDASGVTQLEERAQSLSRLIEDSRPSPDPFRRSETGFAFGGPGSGTLALIIGPDGTVIRPVSFQLPAGLPEPAGVAAARATTGADIRTGSTLGVPVRILSQSVSRDGQTYVLQIVQDRTGEIRILDALLLVLALGGVVAVLAALAAGSLIARRALVPIRDALRRQREFAADASHELRTPLAVVRASVEHIERNAGRPASEVGSALTDITAEVDHLTALVDDLLLLARSDSGVVELTREPVELGELVTDATASLAALATDADVQLAVDADRVEVVGDPDRLRQLVTILVDNAIRHGPRGGTVTVSVRGPGGDGSASEAVLTVDDDGPGIPAADRARVFDRFWRAPGARPGGTGLGLAIAAWIVERHGGTILVTDRAGKGSRFSVRLPATSKPQLAGHVGPGR